MRSLFKSNPGEDGFVMIVVLLMLSLFALVAIGLQRTVVVDVRLASNVAHRARAEALADGIARLAVQHLVNNVPSAGRSGPFRLDGVPLTCRAGASVVSIAFLNVDGQININQASEVLLQRVLRGVGIAETEATRLAQNIVDFRTAGDQSIAGGSKSEIYLQNGLQHGPKNAPFQSVGELEQVAGITRPLLERLRPLMTVYSRSGVVSPSAIGLGVAMALAGETAAVQDLDRLKASLDLPTAMTFVPRSGRGSTATGSNTYMVQVAVRRGGVERFTRATVVELRGRTPGGTMIREWTELDQNRQAVAPAPVDDVPQCIGGLLWVDPV